MKKILICEDETGVQEFLSRSLTDRKYEVYIAVNGKEAIDKAKALTPDLILLDIRMPKINGLEAAKAIRKFDKSVKIIFITGFQSPEISKEAAKYDICDYVTKNAPIQEIITAIDEALQH